MLAACVGDGRSQRREELTSSYKSGSVHESDVDSRWSQYFMTKSAKGKKKTKLSCVVFEIRCFPLLKSGVKNSDFGLSAN